MRKKVIIGNIIIIAIFVLGFYLSDARFIRSDALSMAYFICLGVCIIYTFIFHIDEGKSK